MKAFQDLDERSFAGALVIVDVDGTLTNDKGSAVASSVREMLERLSKVADVHLFSHGLPERTRMLAYAHGVHFLESSYRKPSRRVIEKLERQGKRLVVIGDKSLTDGLFAANIGAQFVPVQRIRHADDDWYAKFVYILDDAASYMMRALYPVLPYLLLMRPMQWVKNAIVFAPIFFAGEILHISLFGRVAGAALIFSLLASSMYVFNDLRDVEADQKHPTKCSRPIASGVVTVSQARTLFLCLFLLALFGTLFVPSIFPAVALYIIGNLAYSLYLKHVAVVDIVLVAFFYVLRAVAGGEAAQVYVSPWIVLCVLFGALFIVVGKRRAEFTRAAKRSVLNRYSQSMLDHLLAMSATLAVVAYGLYSVLGTTHPLAVFSTIFVLVAILRLVGRMYVTDQGAEYPESLVFKDAWVVAMWICWVAYMFFLFYSH